MQPHDELPPEDQDWDRFRQLSQLGNHWERPGWSNHRHSYHWLLTFEHASEIHELAAQCQEPFCALPQFNLVPLESLHLTLERLAFADELLPVSLEAAADFVSQRCRDLAPFRLRIGWLAGSTGAIRFTALPVEPVVKVRDIVLAQAASVDVHKNAPACSADRFWPHVSIAYSNTAQLAAPIAVRIEALRSLPPAEVLITSLALVELRREERAYHWEVLERVELDK
ncbi:MAG: 2'-5' RNA ligase family protein [Actinomycetota bacterium]|nr:2'-5' RNA ligase family protein [Actinomycetota bacterium]